MDNTIDKSNMYQVIYDFPDHIKNSFKKFDDSCQITNKSKYYDIESIIVLGMGGSAVTGLLIKEMLEYQIKTPIHINKNYTIPNWANEKTLIIASSYSGNTEETLISCQKCIDKKLKIIGFSTGGKLLKLLNNNGYNDFVELPKGLQPRAALGYSFSLMMLLLNKIDVVDKNIINDLKNSINPLLSLRKEYSNLNDKKNLAYIISNKIYNKIPIIYGEEGIYNAIAYRIKCQLEENSKIITFNNALPEMNHNEIEAFTKNNKLLKNCVLIWIRDELYHKRNKDRISITSKILKEVINDQITLNIKYLNNNKICHYLKYIYLGDWISYHCALLNKIDPTIIPNINKLKNAL